METEIEVFFDDGTNSGWDENGRLQFLRYERNGSPVRSFEFGYDPSGNRTLQIDATPTSTVRWEYEYDWLDRLSVVKKGVNGGSVLTVSVYSYDESDNRTLFELPQDLVKYIYSFDDADGIETMEKRNSSTNALIFTETFDHDDDGNMIWRERDDTGVRVSYQWDDFNKLIAVSSAISGVPSTDPDDPKQENHYGVNGFRRKKKAKSGAVTTEYATGLATAVAKGAGDPISYIQGPQILGFEKGGEFFYFLTDALGSVRDICRGTDGAVLQSYDYTENGDKTASTSLKSDKTWVGGLSVNDDVGDSGLYMMGHRHYDPSTARFLNRDPIGFAGGMNLYEYTTSPVSKVDPAGLAAAAVLPWLALGLSPAGWTVLGGAVLTGGYALANSQNADFTASAFTALAAVQPPDTGWMGALLEEALLEAAAEIDRRLPGAGFQQDPDCPQHYAMATGPSGRRTFSVPISKGKGLRLTGFTKHGLNQKITRGISSKELLQVLRNPTDAPKWQSAQETYLIMGKNTNINVVVNESGKLVTTFRRTKR